MRKIIIAMAVFLMVGASQAQATPQKCVKPSGFYTGTISGEMEMAFLPTIVDSVSVTNSDSEGGDLTVGTINASVEANFANDGSGTMELLGGFYTATQALTLTSVTGSFTIGELVTDGTTSATGVIISKDTADSTVTVYNFSGASFNTSNVVTGVTSGATGTISAIRAHSNAGFEHWAIKKVDTTNLDSFDWGSTYSHGFDSSHCRGIFTIDNSASSTAPSYGAYNLGSASTKAPIMFWDNDFGYPTIQYIISGSGAKISGIYWSNGALHFTGTLTLTKKQ